MMAIVFKSGLVRKYAAMHTVKGTDVKIHSTSCQFAGDAGEIEAVLDLPEKTDSDFIAVNCHPHSLHGGSLNNKVVYTLSRAIAACAVPSLRFNFRGVGQSEGTYDEGRGEQDDLLAAIRYMHDHYPGRRLILTGFSFGAYVSLLTAPRTQVSLLLSVAPPVGRFDFSSFVKPSCPWHVLMGDADELVSFDEVMRWLDKIDMADKLHRFSGVGHFFHGQLVALRNEVGTILQQELDLREIPQ